MAKLRHRNEDVKQEKDEENTYTQAYERLQKCN